MDSQKQQIVEKLQASNNILVTVSSNPSVDQLAACIGLTLLLNKLDKHATAVFSGAIPDTIEFLKPEDTIEKNTDSLRDFIIALDKSKADKLRYKVEDKVVKIFITPYRTSLDEEDLVFSQGDFNVDVVLALGVHQQSDLDEAITAHGRILHDATVMCINTSPSGELGSLNWVESHASSLSELAADIANSFDKPMLDEQIATAFLTGIVAETDRFRNEKTSATTMSVSADLMKAGANQQLVAEELDHEVAVQNAPTNKTAEKDDKTSQEKSKKDDGTLEISHDSHKKPDKDDKHPAKETANELPEVPVNDSTIEFKPKEPLQNSSRHDSSPDERRTMVTQPPTFGGTLTANSKPEDSGLANLSMLPNDSSDLDAPSPQLSAPKSPELAVSPQESTPLATTLPTSPAPAPVAAERPTATPFSTSHMTNHPPTHEGPTLTELEEAVASPHVDQAAELQKARDEVMKALNEQPTGALPPIEALNAQPVDLGQKPQDAPSNQPNEVSAPKPPLAPNLPEQPPFGGSPADRPLDMPLPPSLNLPPAQTAPPTNSPATNPNAPPPVPPPMMPPNFGK